MLSTITGDEAKRAREALGASQTAVAAAIGVNRTYYSLFESGRYVLDEQEHQQLREFLADALPAPENAAGIDEDGGGHSRGPNTTAPALESADRSAHAVAALNVLSNRAAEPNGLRSKRTAMAVGDAMAALEPLDYAELLELARKQAVSTAALPDLQAFEVLDLEDMKLWELRAIGLLLCDALYGSKWSALRFNALKDTEFHLHRSLGEGVVRYKGVSLFERLWDGEDQYAPLRRAELAPFVAQAAQKRLAPTLA